MCLTQQNILLLLSVKNHIYYTVASIWVPTCIDGKVHGVYLPDIHWLYYSNRTRFMNEYNET
jgi:hypothetical protein